MPKFVPSFISILLRKIFWSVKRNLAAGVELISVNTRSINFTEAIDSIEKYLNIFINSSLYFLMKLFVKNNFSDYFYV